MPGGGDRSLYPEAGGGLSRFAFEDYLQRVIKQPLLQELAYFQACLGKRKKIYWPTRVTLYYGRVEEESFQTGHRSCYHEGLLTSRTLASHELVLLMYLVDKILQSRIGIPLSLENDGLLFLTRSAGRDAAMRELDSSLRQAAQYGSRFPWRGSSNPRG